MAIVDNAQAIRERAYEIWQREGCPSGREHEHWAEANREFAERAAAEMARLPERDPRPTASIYNIGEIERIEAQRLREALWTPEPFEAELFGGESPVLVAAEVRRQRLAS